MEPKVKVLAGAYSLFGETGKIQLKFRSNVKLMYSNKNDATKVVDKIEEAVSKILEDHAKLYSSKIK